MLGHLGGIFAGYIESRLDALDAADRVAAWILFQRLTQLEPSLRLITQSQLWSWLETIPALVPVDGYRLREILAGAGLINIYGETGRPEAGVSIVGVTLGLARSNPRVYLGKGDSIPASKFLMWLG
jgi:hypothetical protein